jgi:hypothetical protein
MVARKSPLFHWRRDVKQWLREVLEYQHQSGLGFRIAAVHCQQSFPSSELVEFAGNSLAKGLAAWAVREALKEAAASVGISLDAETIDFLADLAIDVILPAAA